MKLSIIIPVFNEEKRIHKATEALNEFIPKQKYRIEVIFVDDGSTDKTVENIKKTKTKFDYRILSHKPNQGKGYAIKRGVFEARGKYIVFLDVDMSTPIETIKDFMPLMEKEVPVIIGTRKAKGANVLVAQNKIRQKMGEVYTLLANVLIANGISDFTCGFKCFSNEAANKIFSNLKINRWSYDAEVIYLARKFGFEIKEVPVIWRNDPSSRVNLLKDSIESFVDLVRIRFKY